MTARAERLPFVLPDFTRDPAWVTQRAKDYWEPRITRVVHAWSRIERESVGHVRRAGLFFASPDELPAIREWADARRLVILPLAFEGAATARYAQSSAPLDTGKPWRMRMIVGEMSTSTLEAQQAFMDRDDVALGSAIGYPECCAEFYARVWARDQWRDTTWPMTINTPGLTHALMDSRPEVSALEQHPDRCVDVARRVEDRAAVPSSMPIACNILLRWLGVRMVPHLPCGFSCAATADMGASWASFASRELGLSQEIELLQEMLSWSIEWTALHGIAEIKTPVLKIATRTDASAHRWAVQREGTVFPVEGATGLVFPFSRPTSRRKLPVTDSRSFADAIAHSVPAPAPESMDNGFATPDAERTAHAVVLRAARHLPASLAGAVLDLGCGNGKLVQELCAMADGRVAMGVEIDASRAAKAQHRLGTDHVTHGSISGSWPDPKGSFRLILLMPGRLLEITDDERTQMLQRLRGCPLVVYAYGDWLVRGKGLTRLAQSTLGASWMIGAIERGPGVEAAIAWPRSA